MIALRPRCTAACALPAPLILVEQSLRSVRSHYSTRSTV